MMLGPAEIEIVEKFKYLGAVCSADMSMRSEIYQRESCAGKALHRFALLYVSETWAITL